MNIYRVLFDLGPVVSLVLAVLAFEQLPLSMCSQVNVEMSPVVGFVIAV